MMRNGPRTSDTSAPGRRATSTSSLPRNASRRVSDFAIARRGLTSRRLRGVGVRSGSSRRGVALLGGRLLAADESREHLVERGPDLVRADDLAALLGHDVVD